MATTNFETILDALSTALEAIEPDTRPGTRFKRWRGEGKVENAKGPLRERAFQWRLGPSKTPRTLSSLTKQWHRVTLYLTIGYNFNEPQQGDAMGTGFQRIAMSDQRQLVNKLFISNALSGVSNVKRLQYNGADSPSETSMTYKFDIEWAESFTA